jgi:hypothetical protein
MFSLCIMLAWLQGIWEQIVAGVIILLVGWMWVTLRSIQAWRKKQFRDRVLLSLNSLDKKGDKTTLKLRTLFERDIHDVFQNNQMEKLVQEAVTQVSENDPLLHLSQDQAWYVLNAVLNRISEQFASGLLKRDMGIPVTSKWYTFCLTFEKEGGVRIQKLRIMLMEKELFNNFLNAGEIGVESDKHLFRIQTLRLLRQEYDKNPHLFMNIELCM